MQKDNIVELNKPEVVTDLLTEVLRNGASTLLAAAVQAEVDEFINQNNSPGSKAGFVRNGYLPERDIQTGIGDVPVKVPRVRDRNGQDDGIKFNSSLIPKYLRRSGSMNDFLPLLYLKGISTNDFAEALVPLVGKEAKNLSPGVISRLKAAWEDEYGIWQTRSLKDKRYVYFWADGIYLQARMEDTAQCVLVILGMTEQGDKELLALSAGYRESKEFWLCLLTDLRDRGLTQAPKLAVGNVLDKLPKSLQSTAKKQLQNIWMAPTREEAYKAFGTFIEIYDPKSTACLQKDKGKLLVFYDFPAEHWVHIRTTNPIESTFASVRHRTYKSKGAFSPKTILTMVFKLCDNAAQHWNRLRGFNYLAEVIRGVKFVNGIRKENDVCAVKEEIAA